MTHSRRRLPSLLAILALAVALLIACDGGDGAPTAAPGASSTPATGTPSTAATNGAPEATGITSAPAGSATAGSTPTTPIPTAAGVTATPAPVGRVASTFTIPTAELPVVRFTTADGRTVDLSVEVPPESEYGIGLSGRSDLSGRGMLFYYPDETGGPGFWMRGTHVDIDIAFVALDGTIIRIDEMIAGTEEIHHPKRAYLAGIEAPGGWYAAHGISDGDRFEFLFDPDALLGLN